MEIVNCISLHIRNMSLRSQDGGEWSASRPRPLYLQGKSPWYSLDRRLGGPQSRSGRGGEEKNSQPLPGLEPPIIQPIAQRHSTDRSRAFTKGYMTWAGEHGRYEKLPYEVLVETPE
jgi:hypothetical protein